MTTRRTTTTIFPQPTASASSRSADPPSAGEPIDNNEDSIMRDALGQVERVKACKTAEAAKKKGS